MNKTKTFTPIYVEYLPYTCDMKEGELYISKEYETASHLCACGCGSLSITPFGRDGWTLAIDGDFVSLHPSILNTNCPNRGHYYLTRNFAILI